MAIQPPANAVLDPIITGVAMVVPAEDSDIHYGHLSIAGA